MALLDPPGGLMGRGDRCCPPTRAEVGGRLFGVGLYATTT